MRKTEREITSRSHINQIIKASSVCRLALCWDNTPYLVPLSFGYDGQKIYFHTSLEGMKIDYMRLNNQVCFEFEHDIRILSDTVRGCDWSVSFLSVIGFGKVAEIIKYAAKVAALNQIMLHYSNRTWE
ncbi:pyridoxamine 5'-phosphate oxidase family protein, partial [candidate division KSB1 bacterium]|nr:pyridoxamine 5'-phosphate oxidase family protein [candidate division KSB1 bacterium]